MEDEEGQKEEEEWEEESSGGVTEGKYTWTHVGSIGLETVEIGHITVGPVDPIQVINRRHPKDNPPPNYSQALLLPSLSLLPIA